eukprot:scaffold15214_cov129-Isochrysis_galbana.AAC.1
MSTSPPATGAPEGPRRECCGAPVAPPERTAQGSCSSYHARSAPQHPQPRHHGPCALSVTAVASARQFT